MTEEIKTCDFYNEKICTLFSKYFGFNVECENLSLCTVDDDDEKECPIKRLEFELKVTKADYEASEQENKELKEQAQLDGECIDKLIEARDMYAKALEEINTTVKTMIQGVTPADNVTAYLVVLNTIETRINEVLGNEQNN